MWLGFLFCSLKIVYIGVGYSIINITIFFPHGIGAIRENEFLNPKPAFIATINSSQNQTSLLVLHLVTAQQNPAANSQSSTSGPVLLCFFAQFCAVSHSVLLCFHVQVCSVSVLSSDLFLRTYQLYFEIVFRSLSIFSSLFLHYVLLCSALFFCSASAAATLFSSLCCASCL